MTKFTDDLMLKAAEAGVSILEYQWAQEELRQQELEWEAAEAQAMADMEFMAMEQKLTKLIGED